MSEGAFALESSSVLSEAALSLDNRSAASEAAFAFDSHNTASKVALSLDNRSAASEAAFAFDSCNTASKVALAFDNFSAASEGALPFDNCNAAQAVPLRQSRLLPRISSLTAALTRELYGREPLQHGDGEAKWLFRWTYGTEVDAEALLRIRIGSAELIVGLINCGAVDVLQAARHLELPHSLRLACLSAGASSFLDEIAALTGCDVELCDAQFDCACHPHAVLNHGERIGFLFEPSSGAAPIRGFVCATDEAAHTILSKLTRDHMSRVRSSLDLPLRCSVVMGSTALAAQEIKALEPHDIVLIDDAISTPEVLGCRLHLEHCSVGRGELRLGKLCLTEWNLTGERAMMNRESDHESTRGADLDDIQVGLRFELAQWQATLAEVACLAPGAVIELGHRIDDQSVSVWVGHRCIGKGQLVAVGDRLGIRLTAVFGAETSAGEAPRRSAELDEALT